MEDRTKEKPVTRLSDGSFQLPLLGPIRKAAKPLEDEIIKTAPAVGSHCPSWARTRTL